MFVLKNTLSISLTNTFSDEKRELLYSEGCVDITENTTLEKIEFFCEISTMCHFWQAVINSLLIRLSIDVTTLITGWIHSSSILRILLTPNYPYCYFFMFIILLSPVDHHTIKTIINILTFLNISYFIELQFFSSSPLSAQSHTQPVATKQR